MLENYAMNASLLWIAIRCCSANRWNSNNAQKSCDIIFLNMEYVEWPSINCLLNFDMHMSLIGTSNFHLFEFIYLLSCIINAIKSVAQKMFLQSHNEHCKNTMSTVIGWFMVWRSTSFKELFSFFLFNYWLNFHWISASVKFHVLSQSWWLCQ